LHLEDNPFDVALIAETLRAEGIECVCAPVDSREKFVAALARRDFDLILADQSLPDFDGIAALELAKATCPDIPFILLSGTVNEESSVFVRGVTDFVPKQKLSRLVSSVRRAIREIEQRQDLRWAEEERDSFFALSADLLCVMDFEGRFQRLNPAWERALGFPLHELMGRTLPGCAHLDETEAIAGELAKLEREGGSSEFTIRCARAESTEREESTPHSDWRWLHWKAIAVPAQRLIYATARDVTEQRLAQQNLRQREEYFRSLIENASDIITVMNTDATIRYESPSIERVLGYRGDELVGRNGMDFVHPDDRTRISTLFQKVVATPGLSVPAEFRFRHKNGSWRVLECTGKNLLDATGIAGIVVNSRDITERKIAEEEIQRLAAFPRQNPRAVLEFDRNGALTYFNDAAHNVAQSLGKNHPSQILPQGVEGIAQSCLATGQNRLGLETTESGRVLSWSFYPIPASGVVHCYAEDISERKRFEEQVREQAALLDKAQDAISVGDLNHRIIYWNQGAERLYGWTVPEAIGQNALELFHQKKQPELEQARQAVHATGEWSGELKQTSKSGADVIVQSRWTLVRGTDGQPKSILVIATDITEKKKLQAQFLRAQRLESIGTLASGIAHDLNNVLAPIMMSVTLLQESLGDDKNARLLETLRLSAERGADMVKQILSFTRGQESSRCLVNLKHLVSDLAKILRETFPKTIQIRTSSAKDQWAIIADATQMHQVLMNLAVNARDAMPQGGSLTVQTENIILDEVHPCLHVEAKPGRYVALTVSDTGIGISPEMLDKIFDPFVTTKAPGKGTGLGLSTTLSIVRNHGGFIVTDSQVGKGTQFKIYFPAVETDSSLGVPEVKFEPPRGRGERILVVDDEKAFQEITKAIFNQYGYRVLTAGDGAEALAIFAQHKGEIDVVLTDMMMPFLDGPATMRALQHIDPEVRIIAASGLAENELIAQKFPNAVFLAKPFTTEKLLCTVDQTLKSRLARP